MNRGNRIGKLKYRTARDGGKIDDKQGQKTSNISSAPIAASSCEEPRLLVVCFCDGKRLRFAHSAYTLNYQKHVHSGAWSLELLVTETTGVQGFCGLSGEEN